MLKKFKNRYNIITAFFIIFAVVIVNQLVNIQLIHGSDYYENSQRRLLRQKTVTAPRGRILDRNGVPIASNRQGFTVSIVKAGLKPAQLNEVLLKLAAILDKNLDNSYRSLENYLSTSPLEFRLEENDIVKWQKDKNLLNLKDSEILKAPGELFDFLKKVKFNIDEAYSQKDAFRIMVLRYEILKSQWNFDTGLPVYLASDISRESVAEIEERHYELAGVTTGLIPVRNYIDAAPLAHVTGYVGMISAEQLKVFDNEIYDWNDVVGQTGIELAAEKYLKGKDGQRKVEVDTNGRETKVLAEEPAVAGNDVVLTIDTVLQKVAVGSLEKYINEIRQKDVKKNFKDANAGAVVAIDVTTGEVLVMASYPSYDPAVFLQGSDNREAQAARLAYFSDSSAPMFNRAIQGKYAPGSTFKPIVAIAGLQEGIITPNTVIRDTGSVNIGGMDFYCLEYDRKTGTGAHGNLILERALATSCNIFFQILGYRTNIDNIDKWAEYFGLGARTGIDIPDESNGLLASRANKKKLHNDDWRPADTAQASIGQFDNAFTPLQLANYASTLANGGKRFTPYLIKRIISPDGSIIKETIPEFMEVPVSINTINAVKKGMIAVTNSVDGTAVNIFRNLPFKVAGKTGTAETGNEANHSSNALFVCYAPADNPKIAIAVVVEKGVWGAYTAPIARDVLEAYFNLEKQREDSSINPVTNALTQ